jgi:hypothetical protein
MRASPVANRAEQRIEPPVVVRVERMGDDPRHELARSLDVFAAVLVDVDHDGSVPGARKRTGRVLVPPTFATAFTLARMDAEAGTGHYVAAQSQREQQFRKTRNETGDARCRTRARMHDPGPVCGNGLRQEGRRGLRPARANAKS